MNGEILHEAKTVYDQEAYNALAGLMIRKLRKWPRLVLIFTGFVSVAGAAAIMIAQGLVSAVGAIVLLTGNLLCMFGLYAQRFAVRMMMASSGKGDPPVNRYLFGPDGMRVCAGGGERDYPYAAIHRVLEMSGFLFFFCSDGQVYMMRCTDVRGSAGAFRRFLEERLTQSRAGKGGGEDDALRRTDRQEV